MKAYWDSSALVKAFEDLAIRMRLRSERGFTRPHALAEVFSALTGKLAVRLDADAAAEVAESLAADLDFIDLTAKEITELATPDAITAFLAKLGYDTSKRIALTPESIGLSGEAANAIKKIELLSEDPEQFLRVVFAQPKSLTAKVRNDLVRVLGKSNLDHMLILASDFDTLEFVFLDKYIDLAGDIRAAQGVESDGPR